VVLATRSAGKLRELGPLLATARWTAQTLADVGIAEDPLEAGIEAFETFEENALAKARWFFARAGGLPVLADDSGLSLDALGGRPGVHSKFFAGRADLTGAALDAANNAALVEALRDASTRRGHYVCVMAWVDAHGAFTVRGETSGVLRSTPSGAGGFGYDPYFTSDDLGKTFAEATVTEKSGVSHRGRAVAALLARLVDRPL
jgi:XTP/dITP diphosphohydrolase